MGLFSNLFKKNSQPAERRTLFNLQQGDIIYFDLENYEVVGKLTYNDSGYKWYDYHLQSPSKDLWLSVELDDELELGVYEKLPTTMGSPNDNKVDYDGRRYYRDEKGTAVIDEVWGKAGAVVGQRVTYWDFETEDEEHFLCFEQWGPDFEISKGYEVTEKEIEIISRT
ncbi:DUF4178 domain-containing protein [Alicyclobacillus sp. SO9]|uniref:DUF4178 domain-containing protein n=1 Tax=Alicyclobacillus sp. SO9 TaxID=2665646 RepID=UPI0018E75128|nr:DUF4178 domain-containing protein [Alicyclobacillus sp. SO9]QQE76887.1 DUF4178 domain-containing protein [Alicyclobacillus sp. SO9]